MLFKIEYRQDKDENGYYTIHLDDRAFALLEDVIDGESPERLSTCDKEDARIIIRDISFGVGDPDSFKVENKEVEYSNIGIETYTHKNTVKLSLFDKRSMIKPFIKLDENLATMISGIIVNFGDEFLEHLLEIVEIEKNQ